MRKCPYCAEEIQDEAIVCRYCGRNLTPAVEATQPVKEQVAVAPPNAASRRTPRVQEPGNLNALCPIGSKEDPIEKVSAVVKSGEYTGVFSGPSGGLFSLDGKSGGGIGYTRLYGTTSSTLARLLAAPKKPSKLAGYGWLWLLLWFPAYIGIGCLATVFSIPAVAIMLIGQLIASHNQTISFLSYSFGSLLGAVSTFLAIFVGVRFLIRMDRQKRAQNEPQYRLRMANWDRAMKKWDQLYYCHRHDIVFDPKSDDYCPPTSLYDFIKT